MKNLSTIISAVLFVCICVLFYLYLSLKPSKAGSEKGGDNTKSTVVTENIDLSKLPDGKIAFINFDSINAGYDYIKDESKILNARQQSIESQYQSMTMKLQADYQAFQEHVQAGIAPRSELEKEQAELQMRQNEIINKENQMKGLEMDMAKKQAEMAQTVNAFIAKFNEQFHYDFILAKSALVNNIVYSNPKYDITGPILKGLNEEYRAKQQSQKTVK